jgi:hypothetical protein
MTGQATFSLADEDLAGSDFLAGPDLASAEPLLLPESDVVDSPDVFFSLAAAEPEPFRLSVR